MTIRFQPGAPRRAIKHPILGNTSEHTAHGSLDNTEYQAGPIQQHQSTRLDTSLVLALYADSTPIQRKFIDELMYVYRRFANRRPDTTLADYGDIDGNGQVDTLWSHVTLLADTVRVHSWWDRDGERKWEYELIQPYLWISDAELFQWWENSWISFAIGIFYAPASLHMVDDLPPIVSRRRAIQVGLRHLERKGHHVSEEKYVRYLDSYRGMLVSFGHPEGSGGLHIWYEPLKIFIQYYHP